jgi:hypothetical protein
VTLAQRTVVECPDCGGEFPWELLIALLAVLVAAGALWISAREHREFMRQTRARARFNVGMAVINIDNRLPDDPIVVDATEIRPVIRLSVENYGERAAAETLMNVLAPRTLQGFGWCAPDGTRLQ